MLSKFQLTSFENSSLLRKLSILYFLMSILPVAVLYYLYLQIKDYGRVVLTEDTFSMTLFFVVIGVTVGYFAMRSMIIRIVDITRENKEAVEHIIGRGKVKSFNSGNMNEIAILAKSFNEITSRLEENVRNLELAKKTLHSVLARVGEGISSMENIDNFLNLIVETVTEALQCKVGILLLTEEKGGQLAVKAVCGKDVEKSRNIRISSDNGIFRTVIDTRQPVVFDTLPKEVAPLNGLITTPVLCAPLLLHEKSLGVIAVCGRKMDEEFDLEEKNLLQNLALQTAVAVENSRLNEDAEKTYFETISALALAVEAKDTYSRGHSDRVAKYAVEIGAAMKLSSEDLKLLRDAAKLHDLGKIGVTDKVLKKNGPLDPQEREMMNKHPEIGEGIIKPIRSLRNLCDIIRHHHEKLDGSGYPDGLRGEYIHPLVRILAIADIYDALTTSRPYREAFSTHKAIEILRDMRNQVDQNIVDIVEKMA